MHEDDFDIDPADPLARPEPEVRPCAFDECAEPGEYRAPQSPDRLDSYIWLCLEHVRKYNRAWNYYAGMNEDEIEAQIRHDTVWQRPTWPLGDRGRWADDSKPGNWRDVFELFEEARARRGRNAPPVDHGPTIEDRALATLDLESTATLATVKTRYKQLVKRYHPDANGGDQSAEERLKSVIEAYSVLKNALQP
jgi:hypothetical protein